MDISCRNTKQSVGILFTNTNHITLKYVTDNWGTDMNGFKLVITAIKDPSEYWVGGKGGRWENQGLDVEKFEVNFLNKIFSHNQGLDTSD